MNTSFLKNKKVVFSANSSWYIYNFRITLIKLMLANECQVIIVAPQDHTSEKLIQEGCTFIPITMENKGSNPFSDYKVFKTYKKVYKKEQPDIVLNFTIKPNIYSAYAAYKLNIPTINNVTGLGNTFIQETWVSKVAKVLYTFTQPKVSKIFFQNPDDQNFFLKKKYVSKANAILLPGEGINLQRFVPDNKEQEKDEKFKFLFVGRILWDKGVGEYVEAARTIKKTIPDIEFQLLGFLDVESPTAISKVQMDEWVNEGIVTYLGETEDVRTYIKQASCIVLPSFYREGIPRTLLESAAIAKPIITTNSVGCKEAVDHEVTGFLCEPRSAEDLTKKMQRMINLPFDERIMMGKKGREKVQSEFDEKIVVNTYLQQIEALIK